MFINNSCTIVKTISWIWIQFLQRKLVGDEVVRNYALPSNSSESVISLEGCFSAFGNLLCCIMFMFVWNFQMLFMLSSFATAFQCCCYLQFGANSLTQSKKNRGNRDTFMNNGFSFFFFKKSRKTKSKLEDKLLSVFNSLP